MVASNRDFTSMKANPVLRYSAGGTGSDRPNHRRSQPPIPRRGWGGTGAGAGAAGVAAAWDMGTSLPAPGRPSPHALKQALAVWHGCAAVFPDGNPSTQ